MQKSSKTMENNYEIKLENQDKFYRQEMERYETRLKQQEERHETYKSREKTDFVTVQQKCKKLELQVKEFKTKSS